MYFRKKKTPNGQVLQLLESYRNAEGQPRNRVVVSLGGAKIDNLEYPVIAKAIQRRLYGYIDMFSEIINEQSRHWIDLVVRQVERQGRWMPLSESTQRRAMACAAPQLVPQSQIVNGVVLDDVEHSNTTMLGPVLLGLHAWNELGLHMYLSTQGFNNAQCNAACIDIINRLVDPVSEHYLPTWFTHSSLPDLLDIDIDSGMADRFYRVSDKLLKIKCSLEEYIRNRQAKQFNLDRTVLLYDLTNSHFEGACNENPKAQYGKNKQKRNDCPQIVVGMVFDRQGFELVHKVFEGNRNDSTTLVEMLGELEDLLENSVQTELGEDSKPLVIVDAGVATRKNLGVLRDKGYSYLVNDSRRGRKRYEQDFLQETDFVNLDGRKDSQRVKVRIIEEEHTSDKNKKDENDKDEVESFTEKLVLCKSEARGKKEQAIVSKAETRFLKALELLASRIEKGQLIDEKKIQQNIGRIKANNKRVQRFYDVSLKELSVDGSDKKPRHKLEWNRKDTIYQQNSALFGCYVLRTDILQLSAQELWNLYITLTRAEDGFRALKSDLGLRPNQHRKEERVDAHVFITVLAYQLLRYTTYKLEQKGDTRCWETIKRLMQTHCYTTMSLPTNNGDIYHLRKAGRPELEQKTVYEALGVDYKNLPATKMKVTKK